MSLWIEILERKRKVGIKGGKKYRRERFRVVVDGKSNFKKRERVV